MDPFCYFLAMGRLAMHQACTWGHPVTSGIHGIQWYLSGDVMDREGNEAHYTEDLYRLPLPSIHYQQPSLEKRGEVDPQLVLCPQSLFKLHPDFDAVILGILERVPEAHFGLLKPEQSSRMEVLCRRLEKKKPEITKRIRWFPSQERNAFLGMLAGASFLVDPFPFGGGNTTLEAIGVGTPVLTVPSSFLRGRLSLAWIETLDLPNHFRSLLVHPSVESLCDAAALLLRDFQLRNRLSEAISMSSGRLFSRNDTGLSEFVRIALKSTPRALRPVYA
jgi:predicted O-linked N-acetylglucosamine transferase (SPINDLY family)